MKGKVIQGAVAYIGRVDEGQVPYPKAAYATKKSRLVWNDEGSSQDVGCEQ